MIAPLLLATFLGQLSSPPPGLHGLVHLYDSDGTRAGEFIDLRSALEVAHPGAVLVLEPGVYAGPGNRELLVAMDVTIRGLGGSDVTVIDCRGRGRAFEIRQSHVVLEGMTIRNGVSRTLGGAVLVESGSLLGRDLVFERNQSESQGGAVSIRGDADCRLGGCRFVENAASQGGAVSLEGPGTFHGCTFLRNSTSGSGGAVVVGVDFFELAQFVLCEFEGNEAGLFGGAVSVFLIGDLFFDRCRLMGNSARLGGAVYALGIVSEITIQNTLIAENSAVLGAGVSVNVSVVIQNCTVVDNASSGTGPAGVYATIDSLVVNSVLRGNRSGGEDVFRQQLGGGGGAPVPVAASNVEGAPDELGNIDVDPLFVDPVSGDFRLVESSLCIDAGIPLEVAFDQLDLDNGPRIQGASADMGAYEWDPRLFGSPETASGAFAPRALPVGR